MFFGRDPLKTDIPKLDLNFPGLNFRVWIFGCEFSGFEFSGFEFSGLNFRIWVFRIWIFRVWIFWVWIFGFEFSGFEFSDLNFRGLNFPGLNFRDTVSYKVISIHIRLTRFILLGHITCGYRETKFDRIIWRQSDSNLGTCDPKPSAQPTAPWGNWRNGLNQTL